MISDGQLANAANFNAAFLSKAIGSANLLGNFTLVASVASNNLTITVKTKAGTDPTSTDYCTIGFRDSTATSGGYNIRTITSALSIVVPNGATLGHSSAFEANVGVYLIDNAGTVDLAVSGFHSAANNDGSLRTTIAISAGSTSGGTVYSNSAYTLKPIRFVGRVTVTEATAGVWATAPSLVEVANPSEIILTSLNTSFTPTGSWSTNTTYVGTYFRLGAYAFVNYYITLSGAPTSATLTLDIPAGLTSFSTSRWPWTTATTVHIPNSNVSIYDSSATTTYVGGLFLATATTLTVKFHQTITGANPQGISYQNVTQAAPVTFASGDLITVSCMLPITGWRSHSPNNAG